MEASRDPGALGMDWLDAVPHPSSVTATVLMVRHMDGEDPFKHPLMRIASIDPFWTSPDWLIIPLWTREQDTILLIVNNAYKVSKGYNMKIFWNISSTSFTINCVLFSQMVTVHRTKFIYVQYLVLKFKQSKGVTLWLTCQLTREDKFSTISRFSVLVGGPYLEHNKGILKHFKTQNLFLFAVIT